MTEELVLVRCNMCYSIYEEEDLAIMEDAHGYFKGCPTCKTDAYLMEDFLTEDES